MTGWLVCFGATVSLQQRLHDCGVVMGYRPFSRRQILTTCAVTCQWFVYGLGFDKSSDCIEVPGEVNVCRTPPPGRSTAQLGEACIELMMTVAPDINDWGPSEQLMESRGHEQQQGGWMQDDRGHSRGLAEPPRQRPAKRACPEVRPEAPKKLRRGLAPHRGFSGTDDDGEEQDDEFCPGVAAVSAVAQSFLPPCFLPDHSVSQTFLPGHATIYMENACAEGLHGLWPAM
jgi:hypothetical protein